MKSVNENYFKSQLEQFQKSLPFKEIFVKQYIGIVYSTIFLSFLYQSAMKSICYLTRMQTFLEISGNFCNEQRLYDSVSLCLVQQVKYQFMSLPWTFTITTTFT